MSRKYRQAGYQDEERGGGQRDGRGQARPPVDRLRSEAPRGRGLGAPSREVFRCARCGTRQAAPDAAEVAARCERCRSDLHTCTHCLHFDTSARFQCRQPVREVIAAKSKSNECTLFGARVSVEHEAEKAEPSAPRAAFDDLFKGL